MYAEGKGVVTRGRVAQGFVQVGDKVQVLPLGDPAMVSRVEHLVPPDDGGDRLTVAIAGDTVELNLSNVDPSRVTVGNVVVDTTHLPRISNKATAKVLIMDELTVPIIRGAQVLFHMHSLDIPAVITKLISTLKPDGSIIKERPRALTSGVSAVVELKLDNKIVMEAFQDCRALGRFVLRRGGDTIAVGVI
jgi:elongation factor 1 alpha-like protein